MKELMIFEGQEVEVFEVGGRVLFNPSHVGVCLGMAEATVKDHFKTLDEDELIKLKNSDIQIGGSTPYRKLNNAGENFLTQEGVLALVMKSRKPEAIKFQKWVTKVVIPSIMSNGGYIMNQEKMTPEQIVANALLVAQNIIEQKDRLLEEQRPRVEFADRLLKAKDNILVREFAKIMADDGFSTGEKRMYKWLKKNKYLMASNEPYQKYIDNGTFLVKSGVVDTPFGTRQTWTTLITPKGQLYLFTKLKDEMENQ